MNPNPWFVSPHINPDAGLRLFLFPYAGGGPAVFGKWSAGIPDNVEMWVAHYPGRGSRHREPSIKELDILVEGLALSIQPLLEKPFAFFGHSMGALVAFELTRHLNQNNLPQPIILFISGCGAPQRSEQRPLIHILPDDEFLLALKQFNGIPVEFLQKPDAMELLLPILRADFQAIENYHFITRQSKLGMPIIAYGGLEDPRVSQEALEGWTSQTSSSFKSIYFSGDHFFINIAKDEIVLSIAKEMMSFFTPKHR